MEENSSNIRYISPDSKVSLIGCRTYILQWQEVQSCLGGEGKPVVHNRGSNANPFGATLFFGYNNINLIFEVMQNNYIASVCIFCP